MVEGTDGGSPFSSVRFDLGEGTDPRRWAPTPVRYSTGRATIWKSDGLVAQPDRWGVIQDRFPITPCTVEIDPVVASLLPMPRRVEGFVDRTHRPIELPVAGEAGRRSMRLAGALAGRLEQISGVRLAFSRFSRTLAVITPVDGPEMVRRCRLLGLDGLRPIELVGGGVVLSVSPLMSDRDVMEVGDRFEEALSVDLRTAATT